LAIGLGLVAMLFGGCGRPMLHVRDEAGRFSAESKALAENELRSIAARTKFYAVIVTVPEGRPLDPPRIFSPIMEEVRQRGGVAYILIVEPGERRLHPGYSNELERLHRAELLPEIGIGLRGPTDTALLDWVREVSVAANAYAR